MYAQSVHPLARPEVYTTGEMLSISGYYIHVIIRNSQTSTLTHHYGSSGPGNKRTLCDIYSNCVHHQILLINLNIPCSHVYLQKPCVGSPCFFSLNESSTLRHLAPLSVLTLSFPCYWRWYLQFRLLMSSPLP